ncbi:hypothetical protein GCM10020367_06700 [Streptomyces sannanensis]|uniref:IstB-like ATP-binding domain-containing protein n=1 Tax=Streptomyces sannanensis TaxID=285536 RepID=A0ABP6S5D9_9ACTN
MSELVSTRIRNTAGKLGLPHLAETINEYTRRADEGKMGYLDFLDLVLSEELAVRDDRRFRQGLRLSRLPHHKTLQLSGVVVKKSCKVAVQDAADVSGRSLRFALYPGCLLFEVIRCPVRLVHP